MTHKPQKLTPNQMRNIFYQNGGEGQYSTWTQVASNTFKEWPPGETSVMFFYKGSILVGASAEDKVALDTWRRKYTLYALPKLAYTQDSPSDQKTSFMFEEWFRLYTQGHKQKDIAEMLGVSSAYCSTIKKRMKSRLDKAQQ